MKNKYNKAWHENSWKTADEKKRESVCPWPRGFRVS